MPQPSNPDADTQVERGKRRFFRNTGFSLVQQLVATVLGVLLVPFLLWRLGTEVYGLWLTLQIFSIFGLISLADLGIQGAVVRYLVRFHAAGDAVAFRSLLATAFVAFVGIGSVAAAGLILFAQTSFLEAFSVPPPRRADMQAALTLSAIGLLFGFPGLILKAYFAGLQDVATLKIWETLDRVIFAIGMVALLFFSDRLIHMAMVEQATAIGLLLGFAWLARSRSRNWFTINPRHATRRSLEGVTGLSGMVFATSLSNQIYIKAPEALIGASLGPVALAHYQIATRIPRVLKSVQGALNAAVLPYVAGIESDAPGSGDAKRRFALLGLRTNYILFVPVAVFIVVYAVDILRAWVGDSFAFLAGFLALYALWQLSSVIVGFGNATLTRSTHYRRLTWQNIGLSTSFVIALSLLLKPFGLSAVFALLLAFGLLGAGFVLVASRDANGFGYREFFTRVLLGPVFGSAALGALTLLPGKFALSAAGPLVALPITVLGGSAYLAAIYFLILDKSERSRLGLALAKLVRRN